MVHYLHNSSIRPKLVVLKPERTFCTRSFPDRHFHAAPTLEKKPSLFLGDGIDSLERGTQVHLSTGTKCSKRWGLAIVVAIVFVTFGLVLGVYFGFKLVESATQDDGEKMFRGSFRVVEGDTYTRDLKDISSSSFKAKANFYKKQIDLVMANSVLRSSYLGSEILALDPGVSDSDVIVHFNVHLHPRKTRLDAGDVYLVLATQMDRSDSTAFTGLTLDMDSLEIKERKREYSVFAPPSFYDTPSSPITSTTSSTTEIPMIVLTATPPPPSHTKNMEANESIITKSIIQCQPIGVPFCSEILYHNETAFPNLVGHKNRYEIEDDIVLYRQIVDAECYKYTRHFICSLLQPACVEQQIWLPCRSFCQLFLTRCRNWLSDQLLERIRCQDFPSSEESSGRCIPEPDCSGLLRVKGFSDRICDGIVDCEDFSDEKNCEWCKPHDFICGQKACVAAEKRCNSEPDCPDEADERNCLTLASRRSDVGIGSASRSEGFLFLTEGGYVAKVCTDTLNRTSTRRDVILHNIGLTTCDLLNYRNLDFATMRPDPEQGSTYFHIMDPLSSTVSFVRAPCHSRTVVYVGCADYACGVPGSRRNEQTNNSISWRLQVAVPGDWPWQVALLKEGIHTCDGTLVSNQWVLTSHACFQGQPRSRWMARVGATRLTSVTPYEEERRVIGLARSPLEGSTIVLIKLSRPVRYSEHVRPSCLATNERVTSRGRACVALGWDKKGEQLQARRVSVATTAACESISGDDRHNVCAVETSAFADDCKGEERPGGSLLCNENGQWLVAGVLNWRVACGAAPRPRLYDTVAFNADWIQKTIDSDLSH